MDVVTDADVGREPGLGGSRRQLKGRRSAGPAGKLEQQLLQLEVASVGDPVRPDRRRERHRQGPADRDSEPDPETKRRAIALSALELADP